MPEALLAIALGGAIGGAARHALGELVQKLARSDFPWGTLSVNFLGSLGIGLVAPDLLPEAPDGADSLPALFILVGLFGSFTTVSTFSQQTLALFEAGHTRLALGNVLASIALCVGGAGLGFALAS